MRRQGGHSQMHMAEVVLKNLKKVYPNTEKKKKKGEPEKKNDLPAQRPGFQTTGRRMLQNKNGRLL